jgi:Tol biopolymer transport system component
MKYLLRTLSIIMLAIIATMTYARRENSGWMAFASNRNEDFAIFMMSGDGESLRQVTRHHTYGIAPSWSPDGRTLAFVSWPDRDILYRVGVSGAGLDDLSSLPPPLTPEWSLDGAHLVVWRGEGLYLVDARTGEETLLVENYQFPQFSPDGDWIYAVDTRRAPLIQDTENRLERIHISSGRSERLLTATRSLSALSWSPDGSQFVLRNINQSGDELIVMDADGGNQQVITFVPGILRLNDPQWSPDGDWIAFFGGEVNAAQHLFLIHPDGSGRKRLTTSAGDRDDLIWSPDGEWLIFRENRPAGNDLMRLRADGSSLQSLVAGQGNNYNPQFAPVTGLDWHPFGPMTLAIALIVLPVLKRFRF